jgi:hypothetical protein
VWDTEQQYGMTPRQVDEAVVRYRDLCEQRSGDAAAGDSTERGLFRHVRIPGLMEFIALIGSNMMLSMF